MITTKLKLQFLLFQLHLLKIINTLYIILPFALFIAFLISFDFFNSSVSFCMPDSTLTDCDAKAPSAASSAKYIICDVKYDRAGELIRNANGDPTQFCNKHDSQISAMFDRAMTSVEKQQHQLMTTSSDTK